MDLLIHVNTELTEAEERAFDATDDTRKHRIVALSALHRIVESAKYEDIVLVEPV